jgi:diguanylate cyclase (GGDEF)-like protein
MHRAARAVLAWTIVLGVFSLLVLQGREAVRGAGRRLGFVPGPGVKGVRVLSVEPGAPADRAGVRAGDEIVAAAGRRIATVAEYADAAGRFERGTLVALRLGRGDRTFDVAILPGAPPRWLPLLLNGLTALGFLAVALLALGQGPDLRGGLLAAFCTAAALEIALPVDVVGRPLLAAWALAAYYLLTGVQIGIELHLTALIPDRAGWLRRRRWIVPLFHGAGLVVGVMGGAACLTEQLLGSRVLPWSLEAVDRLLQDAVLPLWALAVTLLLASRALRHPEPRGRQQAGLVLAATLPWTIFLIGGAALDLTGFALPGWTGPLETLILLGYPVAFFAAIFRYDLFDIERAARRGLLYSLLTSALMIAFYAALGAGGAAFSRLVEERPSVWAVSGATLLLGLLFAPLRRALHRLIDRRFFPERHALRQRLIALAGELPALGKLPRMGRHLVERLTSIFLARSALLLLAHPETGLLSVLASTPEGPGSTPLLALDDPGVERLRRARGPLAAGPLAIAGLDPEGLAVPLRSQERLIGVLVVGGKEGGLPYPAEELDLLDLLAHHVASVLENARLFESATYEGLTGLLRREAILEQLDRELERALRYGRPLTVAMADLDHFKQVNDRHGHLAGDSLLRHIASVLAGGLRATDWIGRYGGEEFLLVLPETSMAGAAAVAEKIRRQVQGTPVPIDDGGTPARVTISIGLAGLSDGGPDERMIAGRDLIAAADRSLYEAKHAGRNRVVARLA